MTFRKIDTCLWKDTWFEGLSPEAKLSFIYFWTNDYCNAAGIYEISPKRIEFDTGYRIDTISEQIEDRVLWFPANTTIWVKNFFKHQCQNKNFALSALNSIKGDAFKIQTFINYNKALLIELGVELDGYHTDTIPEQF